MMAQDVQLDSLVHELNRYLDGQTLSLSQMAGSLGVSKGHLSEIKNGKALPALNLGLRILKTCGAELEMRRRWAHLYNVKISEEYMEVHDSFEGKEDVLNLNEKVSSMLAGDLDLMNAYIDIVNSEDNGKGSEELLVEYGRGVLKKLESLVAEDVVSLDGTLYRSGKCSPALTRMASYELMKKLLDDQQGKFLHGDLQGKFQFEINDVDEEGRQKLAQIVEDSMKRAREVIAAHKTRRGREGSRQIFQVMLGKLSLCLMAIGLAFSLSYGNPSYAQGGGLSGGSSTDSTVWMAWLQDVFKSHEYTHIDWAGVERESGMKFKWPEVTLEGHRVSINQVCFDEDRIRTAGPVLVCTRYEVVTVINPSGRGLMEKRECVEREERMISGNRAPLANLCARLGLNTSCFDTVLSFLKVPSKYSVKIEIPEQFSDLDRKSREVVKDYFLPVCSDTII
jgi:transcriptional regulator with XRE-family HTH domain